MMVDGTQVFKHTADMYADHQLVTHGSPQPTMPWTVDVNERLE